MIKLLLIALIFFTTLLAYDNDGFMQNTEVEFQEIQHNQMFYI